GFIDKILIIKYLDAIKYDLHLKKYEKYQI
ncbi:MAG: hypothetical protein ACI8X3_001230, partial [Saprospiraceae bacterium]